MARAVPTFFHYCKSVKALISECTVALHTLLKSQCALGGVRRPPCTIAATPNPLAVNPLARHDRARWQPGCSLVRYERVRWLQSPSLVRSDERNRWLQGCSLVRSDERVRQLPCRPLARSDEPVARLAATLRERRTVIENTPTQPYTQPFKLLKR